MIDPEVLARVRDAVRGFGGEYEGELETLAIHAGVNVEELEALAKESTGLELHVAGDDVYAALEERA